MSRRHSPQEPTKPVVKALRIFWGMFTVFAAGASVFYFALGVRYLLTADYPAALGAGLVAALTGGWAARASAEPDSNRQLTP